MLTGDENIADVNSRDLANRSCSPRGFRLQHLRAGDHREGGRRKRDARIVGQAQIQKILTADRKLIEPASHC